MSAAKPKKSELDETYSEEETARRRDEALLRALRTPPQPRKGKEGKMLNTPPKPHRSQRSDPSRKASDPAFSDGRLACVARSFLKEAVELDPVKGRTPQRTLP